MKQAIGLFGAVLALGAAAVPAMGAAQAATAQSAQAVMSGRPLSFEPSGDPGEFLAHGPRYAIGLSGRGAALTMGSGVVNLEVVGARDGVRPHAERPLPGVANYFIGNDPSKWRTGVPTFGQVRYAGIYPGVDLVYYGTEGRLEYDLSVAAGANPAQIRLAFADADAVRLDARGNLEVTAGGHDAVFERPVAYQVRGNRRVAVAARYALEGHTVGFQLGRYDHERPVVIDPVLSYFSYLGGSGYDVAGVVTPTGSPSSTSGQAAALDSAGELYVTGYTQSANFPVHAAYETAPAKTQGGTPASAFVTKFAADGKSVIFSTYLGGTVGTDQAASIAVDGTGNAIVVGVTGSNDFPVTAGAYQTVCNPKFTNGANVQVPNCPGGAGIAAFVSKFSPSGALLYSTFLSGSNTNTTAYAVAVDASGRAYVAGETLPGAVVPPGTAGTPQAIPFPTTAGAALTTPPYSTGTGGYQNVLSAQNDAFISVFDPTLSTLLYSSLFGEPQVSNAGVGFEGASFTIGQAVTVDAAGNFYLAGTSEDASLPTTTGAYQASASSCGTVTNNMLLNCAFVAKFSPVGNGTPSLLYGTYLGHTVLNSYGDLMTGIAADAAGEAYVVGYTNQATFPTTTGAYQTTCNQYGVNGNTNAQCGAAFIAKLNPAGTALLAGTYFGGYYSGANGVSDAVSSVGPIVLDSAGHVFIDGVASSGLPQVDPLGSNNGSGGVTSPFVAEFDANLKTLLFSTLFGTGGQSQLGVAGLALDAAGNVHVVGSVNSPPSSAATTGAFQTSYGGGSSDVFVATVVVRTATTTTLTAAPTSATTGSAVKFTATVAETGGSAVPTGTVTFMNGTTTLGSMTLNGTGVAVYSTSSLPAGTASVTAVYGGDAANVGSTSAAVSVTVSAPPAPTVTIAASPASLVLGKSTTLTWSSTNATACTASGSWSGSEASSGTASETPTAAGSPSYVITCTGAGGTAHASAAVTVTAPAPTVTVAVAPASIALGQSATVTWSSTGATACTASGPWSGSQATSGTLSVTPSASGSASYSLSCTGAGGSATGAATLTVTVAAGGKSGGGALGAWDLLVLSMAAVATAARRRRRPQVKRAVV